MKRIQVLTDQALVSKSCFIIIRKSAEAQSSLEIPKERLRIKTCGIEEPNISKYIEKGRKLFYA